MQADDHATEEIPTLTGKGSEIEYREGTRDQKKKNMRGLGDLKGRKTGGGA